MTDLRAWHDFYVILGSSSAALIGLAFVVATLGATLLKQIKQGDMAYYITPTFVHFAAVLGISAVAVAPLSFPIIGVLAGLITLWGFVDTLTAAKRGPAPDAAQPGESLWYSALPLLGYAITLLASVFLVFNLHRSTHALAAGLLLLLASGLRNAWAMTLFISTRNNAS